MNEKKTSILSNGLIWFGAAVSIAEILTGTLIAPLGFSKGIAAIIIGHVIGCVILYLAGIIGAKSGKAAMETVKISFGEKGASFFSVLNIIQLLGWTAVMILGGASAIRVVAGGGEPLWCIVIGVLIIGWVLVGIKNLSKINIFAMSTLFLLTIVLSFVVFKNLSLHSASGLLSFGSAVELSAAMPLSWLPLIADYTKHAKRAKTATAVSSIVYFFTSCWMYIIGLGAAIFTGESDISKIMVGAGIGLIAVIIIILSTVTTTFLDVYSAGVSFHSITKKINEKWIAVIVCILGTLLAIFTPITQYENFLYLIGSVFAPMVAILLTDYFILKKDNSQKALNITNFILWIIGFVIYRIFLSLDTVLGNTLPVMIIVSVLCILVHFVKNKFGGSNNV